MGDDITHLSLADMCRLSGGALLPGRRRLEPTIKIAVWSSAAEYGESGASGTAVGAACHCSLSLALALALALVY